ncbi:MAG: 2-succinyl-5-enolpyruvyl-6-hydroxy-3-cyclohexene-1-carboxylic-acid synthase [Motilibacteraceae bacterium]
MNPSTALARVLVDELVCGGVREVVLSPGSRNAPLAFALHDADSAGRLRLHVRIDERSAAFLALGLAKVSQVPVAVACTSGTAAANFHPAVLEADAAGVPLVVLTADRPAELQGTGANQTADQVRLYAGAVRRAAYLAAPADLPGELASARAQVCRLLAAAAGELDGDPGPVHADVAFREPLVPESEDTRPTDLAGWAGRPDGGPWTRVSVPAPSWAGPYDGAAALGSSWSRTLVVVGDCPPEVSRLAHRLADQRGWPLVAEPSGGSGLAHGPLLLGAAGWLDGHKPQRVLVVGRPTLTRPVQRLLADPMVQVEVVATSPCWADAGRQAAAVHHVSWLDAALRQPSPAPQGAWVMPGPEPAEPDAAWAAAWRDASAAAAKAVDDVLAAAWPSSPAVARAVVDALPEDALLVLGSSSVVRDVDLVASVPPGRAVLANRGLAGIDGTVSTALGAALAVQRARWAPAVALLGDLTFLHDSNGLVLGPDEPRPDLTLVVVNDDGGGIFTLLEQGAPEHAASFERVFGTPHGVDLATLCAASGTPHTLAGSVDDLRAALADDARPGAGVRVVEVRTDRSAARELHARLREAVAAALGS